MVAGEGVDVAIVGYGPVGQTLAILLGQRGWRVQVIERWPEPYPLPRAVHFDHEVGRILQLAGVAGALAGRTVPAATYEWRNAAGETLIRQKQKTERRLDPRCIAQGLLVVSLACQIFWVGREAWDPPPDFNDDLLHAALARACALAWRGWLLVAGWSLLVGIALYDRATRRSRTGPAERRASSLRGGA